MHRCGSCNGKIEPGERYLNHIAAPRHEDLGNEKWYNMRECADCADRYGRAIDS